MTKESLEAGTRLRSAMDCEELNIDSLEEFLDDQKDFNTDSFVRLYYHNDDPEDYVSFFANYSDIQALIDNKKANLERMNKAFKAL